MPATVISMDRKRAAESAAADAACQPPTVTPEKAKKPRRDEGEESKPKAKEEGIVKESEVDEDEDNNSEDDEYSDRATGNSIMGFGKYARLTYQKVLTDHYDYVIWAKTQGNTTGGLRNFVDWVESPEGEEAIPQRFTFGMHKGKSFQTVAVEDPSYHRRYKSKKPTCDKLDDYIRYFNRHGNQRAAYEDEMATIASYAGIYEHYDGDYGEVNYYVDAHGGSYVP
jgi:hypothetical protein